MKAIPGLAAAMIVALAIFCSGSGWNGEPMPDPAPQGRIGAPAEGLSPNGIVELRSILSAAKLTDLRWPDFSNYKESVSEIYAATGHKLVWVSGSRPTPEALRIIGALENAGTKGLVAADYDGPRWAGRLAELQRPASPSESELIHFDVALTVSAMRYVYDLHFGRVDPRTFYAGFEVERRSYDLSGFLLHRIARAVDIQSAITEIEPPFPAYQRTLQALAKYEQLAREYKGGSLPVTRKSVKPGDHYSALPQLSRLLRLLGDLPPNAPMPAGDIYEGEMVKAVKHFQVRHGLERDGKIGRETFAALNTPLSRRVRQIELTLERWRWLPHEFDQPPIIVNIPEFRLHAINREHRQAFTSKVMVGKAYGRETPVFATYMDSVIFRPYWNVPYSIQRGEIVPHLRKNKNYLTKHNYQVVNGKRQVVSQGAVNANLLAEIKRGTVRVRQRPGRGNSLGLIKFDMPNHYDVYMHGTPVTSLFAKSRRDFSHGCIRVEDPLGLAVWVLRKNPGWTEKKIRAAMHGRKTFRQKLAKPIPVLIVYGTAIVAENGETYFFRDVYGLDAELEKELAAGRPYPHLPRAMR